MLDKAKNDEKQRGGERAVKWKWVMKMNSEKHWRSVGEEKAKKKKKKEAKGKEKIKSSKNGLAHNF